MDIKEAIEEGKGKERKGFSHKKSKRKKYRNRGWVRRRLLQLSCFGTSDTSMDHGVAVVDEREEEDKKGKHLMIMTVGVGQMNGEIEMKIVDGGNPVVLLQPEVEAVKMPLRPTIVDGDIIDKESKSRPFFHIFSPKAHKKEERKGIENESHPQSLHVETTTGSVGGPVADVLFSPKPESRRSRSVVDDPLLPSSTPKVTQPTLPSCPIFSSTGCRKTGRAENAEVEVSMRSGTEKKTDVVVVKKSDLSLIGFFVFAFLILTTLVGGRAFAAICTSFLFYFAPLLRAESSTPEIVVVGDAKAKKDGDLGIDYDSEEYKKKVVLEGLLERTGRRPAGSSHN